MIYLFFKNTTKKKKKKKKTRFVTEKNQRSNQYGQINCGQKWHQEVLIHPCSFSVSFFHNVFTVSETTT